MKAQFCAWPLVCVSGWLFAFGAVAQEPSVTVEACIEAANTCQVDRDEGQLLRARAKMVACASDACPSELRTDCRQWLEDLDEWLPSISVHVVDADGRDVTDASINIEGAAVPVDGRPIQVDPGTHQIEVRRGAQVQHEPVFVAGGERQRAVTITLLGEPAAPVQRPVLPPTAAPALAGVAPGLVVPTVAWTLGGVGVLALGSFAAFGIIAANEHSELARTCQHMCSDAQVQQNRTQALVADISLATAVAALGAGALWTVFSQPRTQEPRVRATLVPVHDGLVGSLVTRF